MRGSQEAMLLFHNGVSTGDQCGTQLTVLSGIELL